MAQICFGSCSEWTKLPKNHNFSDVQFGFRIFLESDNGAKVEPAKMGKSVKSIFRSRIALANGQMHSRCPLLFQGCSTGEKGTKSMDYRVPTCAKAICISLLGMIYVYVRVHLYRVSQKNCHIPTKSCQSDPCLKTVDS